MPKYFSEHKNWTAFQRRDKAAKAMFGKVLLMRGKIIGQMNTLGSFGNAQATHAALTLRGVTRCEIETGRYRTG